jgi:hypothetical protein
MQTPKAQSLLATSALFRLYQRLGMSFQDMKGKSLWDFVSERELRHVIEDGLPGVPYLPFGQKEQNKLISITWI